MAAQDEVASGVERMLVFSHFMSMAVYVRATGAK